jgi:hypothetical protein
VYTHAAGAASESGNNHYELEKSFYDLRFNSIKIIDKKQLKKTATWHHR